MISLAIFCGTSVCRSFFIAYI